MVGVHGKIRNEVRLLQAPRELLVLDECSNVESQLINHNSLVLKLTDVVDLSLCDINSFPSEGADELTMITWLLETIEPALLDKIAYYEDMLDAAETPEEIDAANLKLLPLTKINDKVKMIKRTYAKNTREVVARFIPAVKANKRFNIFPSPASVEYKILFGKICSDKLLFNGYDRVLHMSATVGTKEGYCRNLGINPADAVFIDCPSPFPIKNRPIIYRPVGKMSYANIKTTLPHMLKEIEFICSKFKGVGGIIHTGSYSNAEYILQNCNSTLRDRLIMPRGNKRDEMLDEYYELHNSKGGSDKILLSPSLLQGLDLPGKSGAFGITMKVPFKHLGDTWIQRRKQLDAPYYAEATVIDLIQSFGRIVRSDTDIGYNFILDEAFGTLYRYSNKLFPKYIKDAIISKK